MKLIWPEVLGEPPQAWVWYESSMLDYRDTSFKLDAAEALVGELLRRLETEHNAIRRALNELGIPGEDYPAPVSNAAAILSWLLDGIPEH
jgi:hypothetical protein